MNDTATGTLATLDNSHHVELAGTVEPLASQVARAFLISFRGRTLAAYTSDLEQWFTWCASHRLNPLEARRVHIDAWVQSMDHQAPATVARKVSTVRGFFEYAVDEEVIGKSPVPAKGKKLHLRKVSTKSQTLGPDREQAAAMLDAARARGTRDHAIVVVLLHQGLRVSELLGITVGDLDRQRGHHTVSVSRKGGERQTLALAPVAVDAIERLRDELGDTDADTPLFGDLSRFGVDRIIKHVAAAAGITKTLSAHSMRHACATSALDAGVPLRDLQVFLGHASPTTTQRYDLGRDQLDRSPAYALSGMFSS